jgi:hypothetical protein
MWCSNSHLLLSENLAQTCISLIVSRSIKAERIKRETEYNYMMSSAKIASVNTRLPTLKQEVPFEKGLDGLFDLLLSPRSKKKTPHSSFETFSKCRMTLLGQTMVKGSEEDSIAALQLIGTVIFAFAKRISLQLQKNPNFLSHFIEEHQSDAGKQLFTVSAPTLSKVLDDFPEQDATRVLTQQVKTISQRYAKQGLMPPFQMLAIDPSDTIYRGKYPNQWTPFAYTGQKNQYKRAFKEEVLYLDPVQMIGGLAPAPIIGIKSRDQVLPLWLSQIQLQIFHADANHSPIQNIYGDREFYSGIGNAFSYVGLWNPTRSPQENPRLIVPKKIWGDASAKKWAFLLDKSSKIVERDEIELEYYDQPYLGDLLSHLPHNPKCTRYMVPVLSVAVFDNYPNGHKPQNMDWAHLEANTIEVHLKMLPRELADAESAYISFLRKNKRKSCKAPSYGHKPRTIFKDHDEKVLYQECLRLHKCFEAWKQKKEKLSKRLMFFTVSLHENETIEGREHEFITMVELYHQRWGVEIGVKLVKWEFPIVTNCRKPTRRHLNWIISALLENSWHFYRLTRAARIIKQTRPEWKPFDPENPVKRKKWNREFRPTLSARGYIMELMANALIDIIKQEIQTL